MAFPPSPAAIFISVPLESLLLHETQNLPFIAGFSGGFHRSQKLMSGGQDDLDLLLSLQDNRVLETPPGSPTLHSSHSPGYRSDADSPKKRENGDMSVFRNAVQDYLDYEPQPFTKPVKLERKVHSKEVEVEKFSGLRIRNQLVTSAELREQFSDIRFIRLSAMKNLLMGDTFSGCWATVGVLIEKGFPKTSSNGKSYCIWKIGCLDEYTVSVFLFGDAYKQNFKEPAGTVFALFNSAVRKDAMGIGFSLSVYSPSQILNMGTSDDYAVCKGKRKDGMACTVVINRRNGIHCKYHKGKASEKYSTFRTELKGGNIGKPFASRLKSKGIYLVDPLADKTNSKKPQPVKLLSADGLRKALSNAQKVTTNRHSQGIRFLSEVTGKLLLQKTDKELAVPNKCNTGIEKRKSSSMKVNAPNLLANQRLDLKRMKTEPGKDLADNTKQGSGKMIELYYVDSDEDNQTFQL